MRFGQEGIWIPCGDLRTGLDYGSPSHHAKGERCISGSISEMEIICPTADVCLPARHGSFGESFPDHYRGLDDVRGVRRNCCTMGHRILKSLCWKELSLKYGGRDYENRSDRAAGGKRSVSLKSRGRLLEQETAELSAMIHTTDVKELGERRQRRGYHCPGNLPVPAEVLEQCRT